MRDSAFGPVVIPPGFWSRSEVRRALADRDLGRLFVLLKELHNISQIRIGAATGNSQGRISDIVRGKYHVRTVDSLDRIATGLGMPDQAREALGLAPAPAATAADRPAPADANPAARHSDPLATQYPATTEQAVAAVSRLWSADADRVPGLLHAPLDFAAWGAAALAWMVSQPGPIPQQAAHAPAVGLSDVARVRATAQLFAQLDNQLGGVHARRSLVHYLRYDVSRLLNGRYTDQVGRELFAAVAEACLLAAWASYDCGLDPIAQRYFIHALRLAESAEDRPLACSVLSAMSHQAAYLGHLHQAASLARAAQTGIRAQPTPRLMAQFLAMEARALARAADTRACHAALTAAERSFERAVTGQDPDFISYFNEAELAAEFGHCFRDLGLARQATEHATRAVAQSDGAYARSDFFAGIVLADAYADQDEPGQACQAALDALQLGEALSSSRCVAYVREFRQRLDRFGGQPEVREFRDQAGAFRLWAKAA
jgi:transcriptional regulator with XRE-family HTH domain